MTCRRTDPADCRETHADELRAAALLALSAACGDPVFQFPGEVPSAQEGGNR